MKVQRTSESLAGLARSLVALARRPVTWLALQMLIVWLLPMAAGGLTPHRVPDTAAYVAAGHSTTMGEALAHHRTYGYPLFLKQFFDSSGRIQTARIPAVQVLVFLAAVLLFWWAFSRFSGAPWLSFAAATALLYSPITSLATNIQPDYLAGALIVAAVSSLMLLAVRRAAIWWIVLAITLFASYQMRPSGVFLIALLPLLGCVYVVGRNRQPLREGLRFAGLLALVCIGPFLIFTTVRGITVGHFGLVSWSKNNVAAMAMCFLDGKLITELPEEHQRLARKLHRARRNAGFKPMRATDDPLLWYETQYDDNLFRISLRVTSKYLRREDRDSAGYPARERVSGWGSVETSHRLGALAKEIVLRRPGLYRRWVSASLNYGLSRLGMWPFVTVPFALLLPSLVLALVVGGIRQRDPEGPVDTRARAILCLAITALTFFAIYLVLVSCIAFPFGRYMASIVLFVPSMLLALLFETWRLILRPFGEQFSR